jgi:hypothetical protein
MPKSIPNSQVRAIGLAMAGAIVAAVTTMFVPVGLLENFTGSTGLSELVPAARAPLGDTARALIAFGAGAFILAILAYLLLRFDGTPTVRNDAQVAVPEGAEEPGHMVKPDRLARLKIAGLAMPKMPWVQDADAITELSDLPKLRMGDTHPDAPPRRPLFAQQDLPVLDLADIAISVMPEPELEPQAEPDVEFVAAPPPARTIEAADVQPTLAEMVAQLEVAVAERQKQLAELEEVAARLATRQTDAALANDQDVEIIPDSDVTFEPTRDGRPSLEIVPDNVVKDDDMDSALAAALATLHRMNGTTR